MLVPSKKHMYTERWSALGQRKMSTKIIVAFSSNIVHQFTLSWFIQEDTNQKSWFDIEGEKLLSVKNGKILTRDLSQKSSTVPFENVMGLESSEICHISSSRINDDLGLILLKSGIIEEVCDREGIDIINNHIKNVESYMAKKNCDNNIMDWLKTQGTVGIERIKPRRSLFNSKLNISCCKIL